MKTTRSIFVAALLGWSGAPAFGQSLPLPTTPNDFLAPGTQPSTITQPLLPFNDSCIQCHYGYDASALSEPARWAGSMHAHAARDPLFLAAVDIANQDAPGAGDTCFRCHAPTGWLSGRVQGAPDGSHLDYFDTAEGVSCHVCHRMVDPVYEAGVSPSVDLTILNALSTAGQLPSSPGNAQYVIDPQDRRRGPFNLQSNPHPWLKSPFHQQSDLCATCHDVSNPLYDRQPGPDNGVFTLNAHGAAHPTGNTSDMFPEQRTYSEWTSSAFAAGGVDMGGRFGGNLQVVSQCQDCHMPDRTGRACISGGVLRNDLPYHGFSGSNLWMLDVIEHLYADELTLPALVAMAIARDDTRYMLLNATDLVLQQTGADLNVRIVNQCGHKLFTGYPEGRRGWINVRFYDAQDQLIVERGGYDDDTATLDESGTKVYEAKHGIDEAMALVTGLAPGPSFHLILNNTIIKDNRIPPRGHTNASLAASGSLPVGVQYPDGQHWDDTGYFVPAGAARAEVRLWHQIASREYMEFLRDTNQNPAPNAGTRAYNAWLATGKSPPFEMDVLNIAIEPYLPGDFNGDGIVNGADLSVLLGQFGMTGVRPRDGDANGDGVVDGADLSVVLGNFGSML